MKIKAGKYYRWNDGYFHVLEIVHASGKIVPFVKCALDPSSTSECNWDDCPRYKTCNHNCTCIKLKTAETEFDRVPDLVGILNT
jgi:hypothetical protein